LTLLGPVPQLTTTTTTTTTTTPNNKHPPNLPTTTTIMYVSRLRGVAAAAARELPRHTQQLTKRSATGAFSTTARQNQSQNKSQGQEPPAPPPAATTSTTAHTQTAPQVTEGPAPTAVAQSPNRAEVWSRSQQPRAAAMSGPRFEQTDFELQVRLFLVPFFFLLW
jgi:NADH dehydrogenase (ubiquinone) Fe-S protein 6